jgi:hypothetical protein
MWSAFGTVLPVAGVTCGLALTMIWNAFLTLGLFRAVQFFF